MPLSSYGAHAPAYQPEHTTNFKQLRDAAAVLVAIAINAQIERALADGDEARADDLRREMADLIERGGGDEQ